MVALRVSLWSKVAIGILVLAVGFTLVSGQVGQAYAAGHSWEHAGGYHGGRYHGGWYYGWYFAPGIRSTHVRLATNGIRTV